MARWFAALLVWALSRLSSGTVARLAALVGATAYALGVRRRVTLDNLRVAFPEKDDADRRRIARGAYANLSRAFLEGLGAAHLSEGDVAERVVVENGHLLDEAMAGGKGTLIATAHFGSWELLGEVMSRRGLPLNAVVKPLRGALNARLIASRTQNGLKLIAPRGALRHSLAALARNEVVVMLVDQVLPAGQGVFVPFFGRLASTNPAFSWAALRSGAPALVVMGAREGDRLRMTVEGPFRLPPGPRDVSIAAHTAQITAVIERHIRRAPEQWLWLHRRWKVPPPPASAPLHAQAQTHA